MTDTRSRRSRQRFLIVGCVLVVFAVMVAGFAAQGTLGGSGVPTIRLPTRIPATSERPAPSPSPSPRPTVVAPRTLAGMIRHPCWALDDADIRALRLTARSKEFHGRHPRCGWFIGKTSAVVFAPKVRGNLAATARRAGVRRTTIRGHRAVQYRSDRTWYLVISVTARRSVAVIAYPGKRGRPRLARRLGERCADAIVAHLR